MPPGRAGEPLRPAPVTNAEFTRALGRALHRPAALAVPRRAVEILLGTEMAGELLFSSQRAVPARLEAVGHPFAHPELDGAGGRAGARGLRPEGEHGTRRAAGPRSPARRRARGPDPLARVGPLVLAAGLGALVVAVAWDPTAAGHAAAQVWTPFVLVTGLLLLGLVARGDGLFDAAGAELARLARGGRTLLVGAALLLAVVTAVLNLDTAVAFLTPVAGGGGPAPRDRRDCLSLPGRLPGQRRLAAAARLEPHQPDRPRPPPPGRRRLRPAMLPAWIASVVTVWATVALLHRRRLSAAAGGRPPTAPRPHVGAGLVGVVVATVADAGAVRRGDGAWSWRPAAWPLAGWQTVRGSLPLDRGPADAGQLSVLVGPVRAGRRGRAPSGGSGRARLAAGPRSRRGRRPWSGRWPACSATTCRRPPCWRPGPRPTPTPCWSGLDLGPNLAVTGALSAVVWLQAARAVGARPSAARYTVLGLVVVPVSMAAALAALARSAAADGRAGRSAAG